MPLWASSEKGMIALTEVGNSIFICFSARDFKIINRLAWTGLMVGIKSNPVLSWLRSNSLWHYATLYSRCMESFSEYTPHQIHVKCSLCMLNLENLHYTFPLFYWQVGLFYIHTKGLPSHHRMHLGHEKTLLLSLKTILLFTVTAQVCSQVSNYS